MSVTGDFYSCPQVIQKRIIANQVRDKKNELLDSCVKELEQQKDRSIRSIVDVAETTILALNGSPHTSKLFAIQDVKAASDFTQKKIKAITERGRKEILELYFTDTSQTMETQVKTFNERIEALAEEGFKKISTIQSEVKNGTYDIFGARLDRMEEREQGQKFNTIEVTGTQGPSKELQELSRLTKISLNSASSKSSVADEYVELGKNYRSQSTETENPRPLEGSSLNSQDTDTL